MSFIEKLFGQQANENKGALPRIILSQDNINSFPKYERLLNDGIVKFDGEGRLRYLHGAPVGDMVLVKVNKDGSPIYRESGQEWFDPESQKAKDFKWTQKSL